MRSRRPRSERSSDATAQRDTQRWMSRGGPQSCSRSRIAASVSRSPYRTLPTSSLITTGAVRVVRSKAAIEFGGKPARQRWRALALAIKAKLEAVETGIATFEEEFLNYIVLPDGVTVGEFIRPQIETAYATGTMPKMLPGIGETGPAN